MGLDDDRLRRTRSRPEPGARRKIPPLAFAGILLAMAAGAGWALAPEIQNVIDRVNGSSRDGNGTAEATVPPKEKVKTVTTTSAPPEVVIPPPTPDEYPDAQRGELVIHQAEQDLARNDPDAALRGLKWVDGRKVRPKQRQRVDELRKMAAQHTADLRKTAAWSGFIKNVMPIPESVRPLTRLIRKPPDEPLDGILLGEEGGNYKMQVGKGIILWPKAEVMKVEAVVDQAKVAAMRKILDSRRKAFQGKIEGTPEHAAGVLDALTAREAWRLNLKKDASEYFDKAWAALGADSVKKVKEVDSRERLALGLLYENMGHPVEAKTEYRIIADQFGGTRAADDAQKLLADLDNRLHQKVKTEKWQVVKATEPDPEPNKTEDPVTQEDPKPNVEVVVDKMAGGTQVQKANDLYESGLKLLAENQFAGKPGRNANLSKAQKMLEDARDIYSKEEASGNKTLGDRITNANRYIFQCMKIRGV
jgi:hypothetical protein